MWNEKIFDSICPFVRGRFAILKRNYPSSMIKPAYFPRDDVEIARMTRCPSLNRAATGIKTIPFRSLASPPLEEPSPHPNSIHLWSIGNIARGPESLLHFSFDESFSGRGQRVSTIKVLEDCLKARRRLAKRFPSPPSSRWNLNSKRGGTIGKPWTNVREDGSLSLLLETKEGAKGKEQEQQQEQQRHQRGE